MKYKAIALDLDGTLMNSQKKMMPKTRELLKELSKKGITIILASGRPTPGMKKEWLELELDKNGGYIVSYNGANVMDPKSGEIIYNKILEPKMAHDIYMRAKEFNLAVMTYDDKVILTEDDEDYYVIREGDTTAMEVVHVDSFVDTITFNINKVLLTGTPEHAAKVLDEFKAPYGDTLSIYRSAPYFIEVMANGIDKAISLEKVINHLGILQSELIAFGDGYNDLSMIEFAGMGVAMDNAVQEVKDRAKGHTASNDDEGIYNFLTILQEKGEI